MVYAAEINNVEMLYFYALIFGECFCHSVVCVRSCAGTYKGKESKDRKRAIDWIIRGSEKNIGRMDRKV